MIYLVPVIGAQANNAANIRKMGSDIVFIIEKIKPNQFNLKTDKAKTGLNGPYMRSAERQASLPKAVVFSRLGEVVDGRTLAYDEGRLVERDYISASVGLLSRYLHVRRVYNYTASQNEQRQGGREREREREREDQDSLG